MFIIFRKKFQFLHFYSYAYGLTFNTDQFPLFVGFQWHSSEHVLVFERPRVHERSFCLSYEVHFFWQWPFEARTLDYTNHPRIHLVSQTNFCQIYQYQNVLLSFHRYRILTGPNGKQIWLILLNSHTILTLTSISDVFKWFLLLNATYFRFNWASKQIWADLSKPDSARIWPYV